MLDSLVSSMRDYDPQAGAKARGLLEENPRQR
jgi:hypothetical protein